MEDLKKQVESILFSVGRKIEVVDIAKLVRHRNVDDVLKVLEELKDEYDSRSSSLMLVQDGTAWKLTVREKFLPIVRKIVTKTELPKSVMETLAIIAYKSPVMQSEIIKVRTNKAYDHLKLLEEDGFISRKKHGRTKLINLSQKFFEYFDIPEEQLRQRFGNVLALEKTIKEKEGEIEAKQTEIDEQHEEIKKRDEEHKIQTAKEHKKLDKEISELPEVDLVDEEGEAHKLEPYATTPIKEEKKKKPKGEHVGDLAVYKSEKPAEAEQPAEEKPVETAAETETTEKPKPKKAKKVKEKPVEVPTTEEDDKVLEEARKEAREEIEEQKKAEKEAETPSTEEKIEDVAKKIASGEIKGREFAGEGIFQGGITPEIARKIDARVEQLVHGTKEHHHDEQGNPHYEETEAEMQEEQKTEENKTEEKKEAPAEVKPEEKPQASAEESKPEKEEAPEKPEEKPAEEKSEPAEKKEESKQEAPAEKKEEKTEPKTE